MKKYSALILLILLSLWLLIIFSPVILNENNIFSLVFFKSLTATTCHQIDYKTIHINNTPLFVCSRCLGIYFGAFLTMIIVFFKKIKSSKKYFLISLFIMGLDSFFTTINFYNYSKIIALLTGTLFGSTVILYIHEAISQILDRRN